MKKVISVKTSDSHDLRTWISSVIAFVRLLPRRTSFNVKLATKMFIQVTERKQKYFIDS